MEMKLSDLIAGNTGKIIRIIGGKGFRQKLAVMGIKEGLEVRIIKSSLSGGPVVIEVERNSIAMGRGMAQKIYVES